MVQHAAKQGDRITALDTHIVLIPAPPGPPIPTPLPHPFSGVIVDSLSPDVRVNGLPAATKGSTADNIPPHVPQGGSFQVPPTNSGQIVTGSTRVRINGRPAARAGDQAITCDDAAPTAPKGAVIVTPGRRPVLIGN